MAAPASYTFTEEDITKDIENVQNGVSPQAPWPSEVGPFFAGLARKEFTPHVIRAALEDYVGKTLQEIEDEIAKELESDEEPDDESSEKVPDQE